MLLELSPAQQDFDITCVRSVDLQRHGAPTRLVRSKDLQQRQQSSLVEVPLKLVLAGFLISSLTIANPPVQVEVWTFPP